MPIDPEQAGPALMAWYALQGEADQEWVGKAAAILCAKLRRAEAGCMDPLPPSETETAIADAAMLLGMLSEAFGQGEFLGAVTGTEYTPVLEYSADLRRRKSGKPVDGDAVALKNRFIASDVVILVDGGMKQEAAVSEVMERRNVSRSTVMAALQERVKIDGWRYALIRDQFDKLIQGGLDRDAAITRLISQGCNRFAVLKAVKMG